MTLIETCRAAAERLPEYTEKRLGTDEALALEDHLRGCADCRLRLALYRDVQNLFTGAFGPVENAAASPRKSSARFHQITTGPQLQVTPHAEPALEEKAAAAESLLLRLGGTPWWGISIALHLLMITLLGLITMAVNGIGDNDSVIVVTSLERAPQIQPIDEQKKKSELRDVLDSKHETPPTDPNSDVASDIVVPPDILAKAELGDHFETVNPDRPDTHSAFGNPDARMFHSESGNDEPEGGGSGGLSLSDDLIGVGGATSPGTGGGWGGGNGTGTGMGNGAGHGSFGARNGGGRKLMVMRHGGGKATESAVDKALAWLAKHQEADGHWDTKKYEATHSEDTPITGLALLAFLGAGHTDKVGKYKDNVVRATKWLMSQQLADGQIQGGHNPGYGHSIAGLALAEAAGMGRDPLVKEAAQKAVKWSIEVMQQGEGSDKLGWRYGPKHLGDISVSGWYTMQLKSAKVAGLQVEMAGFEGASRFLDTVMVEAPKPGDPYSGHKYGYIKDGNGPNGIRTKSTHCNTAIGCLMRQFLGMKRDELQGGVEYFIKEGGVPRAEHPEFYYWYYATLCCFQQGGDIWKKWNEGLKAALVPTQRKDGDHDGSWDPKGFSVEGAEQWGGRVFTTAMGALCLEVYYRYLPLYR